MQTWLLEKIEPKKPKKMKLGIKLKKQLKAYFLFNFFLNIYNCRKVDLLGQMSYLGKS